MQAYLDNDFDIIAVGQSYVELIGEQIGSSLKDMQSFKKNLGGMAANIAIGCARLNLKSALVTRVGTDPLGQFIVETLKKEQVGLTCLQKDPAHATPLSLRAIENHSSSPVIFYPSVQGLDLPTDGFTAKTKILLLTSSVVAVARISIEKLITSARVNGTKIVLCVQGSVPEWILPLCDLILADERSAKTLSSPHVISCPDISAAFVSGFLYHFLEDPTLEKCWIMANACETIASHRKSGSLPTLQEVSIYLSDQKRIIGNSLHSPHFSHIHYALTRPKAPKQQFLFNFGTHQTWQKMADFYHTDESMVLKAKALMAKGIESVGNALDGVGIIFDERIPQNTLEQGPTHTHFVRSVELPGEIPLQFHSDPDITRSILQWPAHISAKVAMAYHPDDRYALRGQQEATLNLLYRACRLMDHPLLIELSPPLNSLITASTLGHIINRFYEIGIYPDWWIIPAPRDPRSWESISRNISENDPHCLGVLVSGPNATLEQLEMMFSIISRQKCCKGFVIGRNLFQPALELWFAQRISDAAFIDKVTKCFQNVVSLWDKITTSNAVPA